MSMKKISVALLLSSLAGVSGAQQVVQEISGLDLYATLLSFPRGGPFGGLEVQIPYPELAIQQNGIAWDCSLGECQLSGDASVDVLLRPMGGITRPVQVENNFERSGLIVEAGFPAQTVQDPLGVEWFLVPDLSDSRLGVLIADNIRPIDAQFMVAYGSLGLIDSYSMASSSTRISNQTGWVDLELSRELGTGMPSVSEFAAGGLVFQTTSLAAPVYALPSLDSNCMSTDCMRYERGTLMVDAYRLSFGLHAVAAVPEAHTWAMMALGLVGLGVVAQRRRSGRLGINA